MDKDTLYYIHDTPMVPRLERLRGWLVGRRDKRSVYRKFLRDNGITSGHDIDGRTFTRDKYFIYTHYVEHLADVRDNHILQEAKRARAVQSRLRVHISKQKEALDKERAILETLRKDREEVKAILKGKQLTPRQAAAHQGRLGDYDASIGNILANVTAIKNQLNEYNEALESSKKEFFEFCEGARNAYELTLNQYIRAAGRKLNSIGFTNYDAVMREFTEETQMKIKELTDGS